MRRPAVVLHTYKTLFSNKNVLPPIKMNHKLIFACTKRDCHVFFCGLNNKCRQTSVDSKWKMKKARISNMLSLPATCSFANSMFSCRAITYSARMLSEVRA